MSSRAPVLKPRLALLFRVVAAILCVVALVNGPGVGKTESVWSDGRPGDETTTTESGLADQGSTEKTTTPDWVPPAPVERLPDADESIVDNLEVTDSIKFEAHPFKAEVNRLLDIIINFLYTKKEIFLRELISNAADALEKIRFLSLSDPNVLQSNPQLEIRVEADSEAKTLTILDTGVGMTKEDLVNNLGTIAQSGTTNFLEAFAQGGGDVNLIGQFGVGFYSAFLVANRVVVFSKHNSDSEQYIWESSAADSFKVSVDPRGPTLGRGTKIVLHLKEDSRDFLDDAKVVKHISKFNQFVNYPIYVKRIIEEKNPEFQAARIRDIKAEREITAEKQRWQTKRDEIKARVEQEHREELNSRRKNDAESIDDAQEAAKEFDLNDEDFLQDVAEAVETEIGPEPSFSAESELVPQTLPRIFWEKVNNQTAIWLRKRSDVTETEYQDFFKAFAKTDQNPIAYSHFSAEGEVDFKAILYLPSSVLGDAYSVFSQQKQQILKVYARRILVTDEVYQFVPRWASFIRGVVDSDDLPLKVDRESVFQSRIIKSIGRKVTSKLTDLIGKLHKEDVAAMEAYRKDVADWEKEGRAGDKPAVPETRYMKIWDNFKRFLRLGCSEDSDNRVKLVQVLRFHSSFTGANKTTSLQEYKNRARDNQREVYYVTGDNFEACMQSPLAQYFLKRGFEVLTFIDPVEDSCAAGVGVVDSMRFVSIEKTSSRLDQTDDERLHFKKVEVAFRPLLTYMQEQLKSKVHSVKLSFRLVEAPAAIVAESYGSSVLGERLMKAQILRDARDPMRFRRLEINPNHSITQKLLDMVQKETVSTDDGSVLPETKIVANAEVEALTSILYDLALLHSGYQLDNPTPLANKMVSLLQNSMGIPEEEALKVFEVPEEISSSIDPKAVVEQSKIDEVGDHIDQDKFRDQIKDSPYRKIKEGDPEVSPEEIHAWEERNRDSLMASVEVEFEKEKLIEYADDEDNEEDVMGGSEPSDKPIPRSDPSAKIQVDDDLVDEEIKHDEL